MKKISRRDFLAASAVVGAAGVLAAGGGACCHRPAGCSVGCAAASPAGGQATA